MRDQSTPMMGRSSSSNFASVCRNFSSTLMSISTSPAAPMSRRWNRRYPLVVALTESYSCPAGLSHQLGQAVVGRSAVVVIALLLVGTSGPVDRAMVPRAVTSP